MNADESNNTISAADFAKLVWDASKSDGGSITFEPLDARGEAFLGDDGNNITHRIDINEDAVAGYSKDGGKFWMAELEPKADDASQPSDTVKGGKWFDWGFEERSRNDTTGTWEEWHEKVGLRQPVHDQRKVPGAHSTSRTRRIPRTHRPRPTHWPCTICRTPQAHRPTPAHRPSPEPRFRPMRTPPAPAPCPCGRASARWWMIRCTRPWL